MTFVWSKILLSSRERRALFKALKSVHETQNYVDVERVDALLDGLDDGGIWNPCFFHIPENKPEQDIVFFAIELGSSRHPHLEHDLKMVLDRIMYIGDRERPEGRIKRWPFLTSGAYYGPNWSEVRKDVIQKDGAECQSCGLGREDHKELYGHDLHVHHEIPKREFDSFDKANDPDNLTTLCFECHQKENPTFRDSVGV